jgi:CheY-like chemotaxis protein
MNKTRVLLVEDDAIQAGLLERAFSHAGATVQHVASGRAALQLVPTFKPEVIITDMLMPVLNGLQLAREVRVLAPATLIIGYSAAFVPSEKERAQLESAFDAWFERTPSSDPSELVAHVNKLRASRGGGPIA